MELTIRRPAVHPIGAALASLAAALSGSCFKAPGFAGGYLPSIALAALVTAIPDSAVTFAPFQYVGPDPAEGYCIGVSSDVCPLIGCEPTIGGGAVMCRGTRAPPTMWTGAGTCMVLNPADLPPQPFPLMAHCAGSSKPGWRRLGRKGGVRSTLNCVLWFRKFEHRLTACCYNFLSGPVGSLVPEGVANAIKRAS